MNSVSNNTEQAKVWLNGQYQTATKASDGNWYAEIDGKKVKVDKNDLFGMNNNLTEHPQYLVNYYDKLIAKNDENIERLKSMSNSIEQKINGAKKLYNGLLSRLKVTNYKDIDDESQRAEAKKYYTDLSSLRQEKTSISNREYSAYMTAFDYALEKGNWQNQLTLAENVQNSIFG